MNRTSLTPRGAVILGVLFIACGVMPILGGLGLIPLKPTEGTPGWIGVAAGLMFVLAGAAVINGFAIAGGAAPDGDLRPDTPFGVRLVQYLLGMAIVGLMTAVSGWIAFGPGERHFSMTMALPFVARSSAGGELSGRIAFGVGTTLLLAMFVGFGVSGARRLRRVRQAFRSTQSSGQPS